MTERVIWTPQPGPQTAACECDVGELFYGGARGGGKSDFLLGDWLIHRHRHGGAARGILFRRTLVEMAELERRAQELFIPTGAKWREQAKTFRWADGSMLLLRYLDKDADAMLYQGHQYTWLGVDEAGNFPRPDPIDKLRATLRSPHGIPCYMRLTGNPGGVGHQWLKARYIVGRQPYVPYRYQPQPEQAPTETAEAVFIPAKLEDNPLLMQNDPEYESRLAQVGGAALYRAWRHGDWNVAVGAAFSEWRQDLHVIPNEWRVPVHWRFAAGMDWGYRAPTVVVFFAMGEEGDVVGLRELVVKETPAREVGRMIGRVASKLGPHPVEYIAADDAMWAVQNAGYPCVAEDVQLGISETYEGLHTPPMLVPAGKGRGSREARVALLHRYLRWTAEPDGSVPPWRQPKLRFRAACSVCIDTIPTLPMDDKNMEDVDTDADDHAYDAVTYFLMARPQKARMEDVLTDQDTHKGLRQTYKAAIAATKRDDDDWQHRFTPGRQRQEADW